MKYVSIFLACLFLGACAGPPEPLVVKQYLLRDQETSQPKDPMVRMEMTRRLHGAVSMEERKQRLGQYFTVAWRDAEGVGMGAVEVIFEYQQGASASRVKRMSKSFPAADVEGTAEFAVIGDDYFEGGKVLAWRISVQRADKEFASRQSYLWR